MKNKNALPSSALLRRALFCSALIALFGFSPDDARAQATNINSDRTISSGTTSYLGVVTIIGNGVPNVTLTVQNPGTVLNLGAAVGNSLYTGYNAAGSGSRVIVTNGGRINASGLVSIGEGRDGVSNNQLIVTGKGSAFVGSSSLFLTRHGFNNSIVISNGGLLSGNRVTLGGNPISAVSGSYSPKMEVTGAGSVLRSTEWFRVGRISAAQLTLGNGGTIDVGGVMSVSGNDPLGSGMLIGNGTVNAGGGLTFTDTGRLAPSGNAPLTVNGNLSFDSGFFDWNLFANSTNNPGTDFTRPIVLNGDISGVTSSRLVVNLTNSVASGPFWDTSRAWDLITTTSGNLGLGTRLGLSFTGKTNGITLANFSLLSTNNALRLVYNAPAPVPTEFYWNTNAIGIWAAGTNWSANLVPGATNKAFINNGGTATVNAAATVNSVVIGSTNGSTGGTLTLSNGALTAPGGVAVASASGSTGVLNFNGGSLAAPTIAFGSGTGSVNFNQTDALSVTSVISGNGTVRQLGAGVTTLGGVNTYVGATVVSNGTLAVTGKLANNAGSSVTVNTGGTLSFGAADVFGPINSSLIRTPLVINGGLVQNSGAFQNILGKVTLSNGGILRSTGVGERGIAFSFSGDERNPLAFTVYGGPGNSRIEGPGIALGNVRQAHTWFDITNDSTMTVAGNLVNGIYGAGQLIKYGAGTLVLTGTNTYTGPTTIWQGTVQVGDGGTSGNLGAGNVEVGGPLVFNRSDNITVPNSMSSWNTVTQIGTGTVTLSGQNTYTGGTVVSNGTIAVTGTLANNAGNTITVNNGATFAFARNGGNTFGNHTANILTPIVINAGGLVTNSGTNFFSALGPITLNGGTLAAGSVGGPDGYSYALKGTVTVNSNSTISGPGISLGAGSVNGTTFNVATNATLTVNGGLTNGAGVSWPTPQASSLTKTGTGTMQLNGTNTYTGTTTISAGTLSLGGAGLLGGGNYSGSILNSGTLVVGTTANQILGGVISGSGALVKDATGTLTLDGVKTYTGTTTINAGTLLLNGEHTGGAAYTVNSGGTLGGLGSTTSLVTVAAGGNITPGAGGTEELVIGGLDLQGRLNVYLDGDSSSLLSVLGGATLTPSSSVSFSQGPNALTAPIYVFLAATNGISGTFGSTNGVPTGYGVFYDVNDGIAFLKNNAASNVATALFEGENAVIGNGSTNFNVYAFNGGTASATFTATAGALTTGGPLSTNITASNGVELSSLTFTGSGTNFGTNTGTFQADFNGQTNTIEYDVVVYDHAKGSLAANVVSLGSAIVGFSNPITGSLQVNASNSAAGFNAPLGADVTNSPTNTLTFTAARDIEGGTSGNLLVNLGTNQGSGVFSNNVTVTFFDDSTLSGATTLAASTNTASFAVTATIYEHASNQLSGTDLFLRPVHQGFRGILVSTNSISVTNASGFRVALGSENTYSNDFGLTVGTVSGLAAGATADIDATYDLTEAIAEIGRATNTVEARFFDDSDLLGANNNLQTVNIQVIGYVYTGKGVWTGNGTDWSAITNWQVPGGTPGLDGALSVNDTATFDTTGTSYTVDLGEDASLRSITFSNAANAYTIGGAGDISLTAASDGPATLANLAGAHSISNNIRMGSTLEVTNATGTQLTLAGVLSGFEGFTQSGDGTLTLASANTYSGTTAVTGGTLQATTDGALSSQSGVFLNGGTIDIGSTTQAVPWLAIATGTHTQTNGSLTITEPYDDLLKIASEAGGTVVYNLEGGTLATDQQANLQVGWFGDGTLNQSGGLVDITGYFVLARWGGAKGTYNLTDGIANQSAADRYTIIGEDGIGELNVGGSGVFNAVNTIQLGWGSGSGTLRITDGGQVNAPGINLGWQDVNRLIFDVNVLTNFSVPVSGAGSVVKAGTGTVVFDQNNSYGGTTTISNGTLVVNGLHSGTGAYTVENSGILAGTGQISAPVTVQSGGTINPGLTTPGEEFIIGNNLTLEAGGILNVFLGGATTSQLQVGGNIVLGPGSIANFSNIAPLTASLYPFLTYGGTISGALSTNGTLPSGFELITNSSDKVVALLRSSVDLAVSPIFNGENAVITGGTLPFGVFVYNNTNVTVGFTAASGLNTAGAVASTTLAPETSDIGNGLEWNGTNVGLNQAGNFAVTFTNGSGLNQTNTVAVTVSVYDHALAQYAPGNTNLSFAPVHARNTNPVATTNSISVANATGDRVNLGVRVEDNTNSAVTIGDVGGVAAGASTGITGLLEPTLVDNPGRFTNTVQLVSFDDSDLNGASVALSTNTIIVTGYIYTGQGEWNTLGGGNWADIGQWQVPGGTPGLDGEYSVNDTALFGANGSGRVTNNGSVQMLSMTFSNDTAPYTIAGTGTITLTSSGTNQAAINTLEGSHTVANNLELGSDVVLSNAVDTELTLSKPVDGPFGLIKEGEGTTTLSAANTYIGGTTVNGGLLNVDSARGLANVSGNALVINEGIVSFNNNDIFGQHYDAINAPVVINEGGTLQNGGKFYNPLGPVYLNGGSIVATDVEPGGGYSFSFKGDVIVDGSATSTIDGPGLALGADDVDFTRFEVADGSTLDITGDLIDGPSANYTTPQPSRLVKEGEGAVVMSGANTYSGGTYINAGTIVAASPTALGAGPVELLAGTLELRSPLQIASLVWDGGGGATQIAIANPGTNFLTVDTPISILNGVNNFNLAGSAPTGPVKLLAAPGLTSNDISLFGFEGLDADAYRLEYGEDGALYLVLIPQPAPAPEPEEPAYPDFTQFAGNKNQLEVAKALNKWAASNPSGDRKTVLDAIVSSEDYQNAFNQMMPTIYESIGTTAFNLANVLNTSLFERLWLVRINGQGFSARGLAPAPLQGETGGGDDFIVKPPKNWGVFVDGYGVFANASGAQAMQDYNFQSGGVTGGASYKWNDNLSTGVYVGYQGLQAQYDNGGRLTDNAVRFGGFGTLLIDNFFFNTIVGGAYHNYQVDRSIEFGSIDRTASGDPAAGEFDFALGGGYDFKAGNFVFGPTTSLQYTYLNVQGFEETGADSLNLRVDGYDTSSLLYSLGGQVAYNWKLSQKVVITPRLTAGWQHEFLQNAYPINSAFATGGPVTPFSYQTTSPIRDYFYGGASIAVGIDETWETAFFYNAIANQDLVSHSIYFSIGAKF